MYCTTVAIWKPIKHYLNNFFQAHYIDRQFGGWIKNTHVETPKVQLNQFRTIRTLTLFDHNKLLSHAMEASNNYNLNCDGFYISTSSNNPWTHNEVKYPITQSQFCEIDKILTDCETICPPNKSISKYLKIVDERARAKLIEYLCDNFCRKLTHFAIHFARTDSTTKIVMDLLVWVQTEREMRASFKAMTTKMYTDSNKFYDTTILFQ